MTEGLFLGFDIGGTRIKSGVVDAAGRILRDASTHSGSVGDVSELVRWLRAQGAAHLDEVGRERFRGVGVAVPGFVERDFGARHLPGKLRGLEGLPLRGALEEAFGLPTACINDGAAAALGEWRFGAAAGFDDALVLTIGTGVGSGVILNGRLLETAFAGTGTAVGHFTIETSGRLCLCGNRGCAETLVSATAVEGRLRDALARGVASILTERYLSDPASVGFAALIEGVRKHDAPCIEIFDAFVRDLGALIVTGIHAYNPSVVVIGGGPMVAGELILPPVQTYVDHHRWTFPADRVIPLRPPRYGDRSGVIGACAALIGALG